MASVASQLIEEVTAHAQSGSLEDARKICADGTYVPNNLRTSMNNRYTGGGHARLASLYFDGINTSCAVYIIPLEMTYLFFNYVIRNKNSLNRFPKQRTPLRKYY